MQETRRAGCRMLVAAAGYGKTTGLRRWFPPETARWHRGTGPGLAEVVTTGATAGDRLLVFDDLPRLPAAEVRGVVAAVDALPHPVTVVLSSRWPPAAGVRRVGPGRWSDLGPADLALTGEQVADLLTDEYGLSGPDIGERVRGATAGWPALVHLVADTLRLDGVPPGPLAAATGGPGTPLATRGRWRPPGRAGWWSGRRPRRPPATTRRSIRCGPTQWR
jgi:ATP/maltotriose-dependent transcriptional regulator MalT